MGKCTYYLVKDKGEADGISVEVDNAACTTGNPKDVSFIQLRKFGLFPFFPASRLKKNS